MVRARGLKKFLLPFVFFFFFLSRIFFLRPIHFCRSFLDWVSDSVLLIVSRYRRRRSKFESFLIKKDGLALKIETF